MQNPFDSSMNPDDFRSEFQTQQDSTLLVKFFMKPFPDPDKSDEAGHPVFVDREYIDIKIPGDRTSGVCRPATEADKARFQRHYTAFKDRVGDPEEGYLLTEWSQISRSQAEELAFFNVKTVEQLASVSDAHAQNFMGLQALKQKAKLFLEHSSEEQSKTHLSTELKKRDGELAELRADMKALQDAIGAKPKTHARKKKATRKKATTKKE